VEALVETESKECMTCRTTFDKPGIVEFKKKTEQYQPAEY